MCGRYELKTEFEQLPSILKKELPKDFAQSYAKQDLIKPTDPVLVLSNEGKVKTSLMLWGFISEWAKDPFSPSSPRPFNARAETVAEKKFFKGSWRHKRCVLPASGFFEKSHLIRRKDYKTFWLAGIWNRWMSREGSELESCCILTTQPNKLVRPLHNRMPVIIPNGLEEDWIEPIKDINQLKALEPITHGWSPDEWIAEKTSKSSTDQIIMF